MTEFTYGLLTGLLMGIGSGFLLGTSIKLRQSLSRGKRAVKPTEPTTERIFCTTCGQRVPKWFVQLTLPSRFAHSRITSDQGHADRSRIGVEIVICRLCLGTHPEYPHNNESADDYDRRVFEDAR